MICDIEGVGRFQCKATDPALCFLVSDDTLSAKEIIDLSFTDRVSLILNEADELTFKDPAIPFAEFRQRQKE